MNTEQTPLWYEQEYQNARLDLAKDAGWFLQLAGRELHDDLCNAANALIPTGSINLHFETDPETFQAVVQARLQFYGNILGWNNETHSLHKSYSLVKDFALRTLPLVTFVETQRVLASHNLNSRKILRRQSQIMLLAPTSLEEKIQNIKQTYIPIKAPIENFPGLLAYAPDTLNQKILYLESLGLDIRKILQRCPSVIGRGRDSIERQLVALQGLGIGDIKLINAAPSLLNLSEKNLREKLNLFSRWAIDAKKVVTVLPTLLGLSAETLETKLTFLENQGFNVIKIVEREPALLGLAVDSLETKLEKLHIAGLDVVKIINNMPSILRLSDDAVSARLTMLSHLGLDAAKVINAQPSALSLSPNTIKRKVLLFERLFKMLDAHTTAAQLIEVFPAALTRSRPKVMATARFVAEHGNRVSVPDSPQSAATLLVRPVTNLLVAAASEEPFSVNAVSTVKIKPEERAESVIRILANPILRERVGAKCIRAFINTQSS